MFRRGFAVVSMLVMSFADERRSPWGEDRRLCRRLRRRRCHDRQIARAATDCRSVSTTVASPSAATATRRPEPGSAPAPTTRSFTSIRPRRRRARRLRRNSLEAGTTSNLLAHSGLNVGLWFKADPPSALTNVSANNPKPISLALAFLEVAQDHFTATPLIQPLRRLNPKRCIVSG